MPIDIHEIAYQLTDDTPQAAGVTTVKLLKAVLDAMPNVRSRTQFILSLNQELAMLGYRLDLVPKLVYFSHLKVGDQFKGPGGKLYRKIEPVPQPDFRGESTPSLTAYDLAAQKAVYISANERVEKVEEEAK